MIERIHLEPENIRVGDRVHHVENWICRPADALDKARSFFDNDSDKTEQAIALNYWSPGKVYFIAVSIWSPWTKEEAEKNTRPINATWHCMCCCGSA